MTEFWVSQAKYYCKICNCYMADNKMSRQHHESSMRHKINNDKLLKEKKNQQLQGARSERELRETLQQIEKAAKDAMIADGSQMFAKPAPPPNRGYDENSSRSRNKIEGETEIQEEENTGFYTIRGITYLDGKVFQDKLRSGRECEIFVEELDDWFPGSILTRREIQVPNTNLLIISFEVQYKITFEDGTEEMTQESNVKSDRLRIIAKAENDKEVLDAITEEAVKFVPPPPPPPPMDENTGVSVWQTVAVKEVDEDEEYDSHQKAVEDMYKLKASDEKEQSSVHGGPAGDVPDYQPKTYKGILIEDVSVQMTTGNLLDEDDEDRDKIVAFKKRKIDDSSAVKIEATAEGQETKSLFKPMKNKNFRKK